LEIEFSKNFSVKYSQVHCKDNPSGGNGFVPCGQTDGRTEDYFEAIRRQKKIFYLKYFTIPATFRDVQITKIIYFAIVLNLTSGRQ
jgi:hypothetical protein